MVLPKGVMITTEFFLNQQNRKDVMKVSQELVSSASQGKAFE